MKLESNKYLYDIKTAADKLGRFIQGKNLLEYQSDDLLKSAVERQFEIIGEALNQLIKSNPDMRESFPDAREIIAFRNLLIHGYAEVDDQLVWNIAETRLPRLLEKVNTLLK